ncbi:MAG: lytic transglycosylase domain-containing protein [Patescibacteria group bacterium]|nr:lytic transglycosylase domain-containing protein [Patescibacteria group bacterium]MDD5715462.1 lytic transglycosylase domain-containing protein [Patescibacteria group bacterium]
MKCCVCLPPGGSEEIGSCVKASGYTPPCQPTCTPNPKECPLVEQCIEWDRQAAIVAAGDLSKDEAPKRILFTPNITIPGSGTFNRGVPIVVTGLTLGEYIVALYVYFTGVVGILATVMGMYGGVKYVVSFGNPQKLSEAKDNITGALMGLLIALGSYSILLFISPRLVEFGKLSVEAVTRGVSALENQEVTPKSSGVVVSANVGKYDGCLTYTATKNGLDRNWFKAIMLVESSGRPGLTSPAGACGLMQLMPATAQKYQTGITCDGLKDPATNITISGKYLRDLFVYTCALKSTYKSGRTAKCEPDLTSCQDGGKCAASDAACLERAWRYISAAYNGGRGANCSSVDCAGQTWWECVKNPGYAETRNYVIKVKAAHDEIVNSNLPGSAPGKYTWNDSLPLDCNNLD